MEPQSLEGEQNRPCASHSNRASRRLPPKTAYRTIQHKAPLNIQVPTKPAYQDNHVVPWQYDPTEAAFENSGENTPIKEVTNIVEMGGVTRSGQIYAPEALRKKTQVPEAKEIATGNMKDTTTGKEVAEFVKLIRHNEYKLLDQMNKTPARISLLSLVINSEGHHNLLLKILNETHVA
ncbi:hypothetical protein CR513_43130, partial [Mucuna pruriens]